MADASRDALLAALTSPEVQRGQSSGFWKFLDRDEDVLYFEMYAWDGDSYVIQLTCDRYGDEAIRGLFVDPASRKCTVEAWPHGDGTFTGWFKYGSNDFFICWPGDRGGIERHGEWRGHQYWKKERNQLHQYLEFIRQCLNLPARGYQPRKQQSGAA
jgi:hypothetical protein